MTSPIRRCDIRHALFAFALGHALLALPAAGQESAALPQVRIVASDERDTPYSLVYMYLCTGPEMDACQGRMAANIGDDDWLPGADVGGKKVNLNEVHDLGGASTFAIFVHIPTGEMGGGNYWRGYRLQAPTTGTAAAVVSSVSGIVRASGDWSSANGRTVTAGQTLFEVIKPVPSVLELDVKALLRTMASGPFISVALLQAAPIVVRTCTPASAKLSNWWTAEEGGRTFYGPLDGTLVNGTTVEGGLRAQAFYFDGSGGYVQLPSVAVGGGAELTVSAWVKPEAGGDAMQAVFSSTEQNFVHLQLSDAGNIVVYTNAGLVPLANVPLGPAGTWRHVALSVKRGETVLYVNGIEASRSGLTFENVTSSSSVRIGSGFQGGRNFKGYIDDVQLYSSALSEAEIKATYDAQRTPTCSVMFDTN